MNREPVFRPVAGSSAITHEHYDRATKTLHLMFTGAKLSTVIEDVDEATYQEFLKAPSKGKFFHERLK